MDQEGILSQVILDYQEARNSGTVSEEKQHQFLSEAEKRLPDQASPAVVDALIQNLLSILTNDQQTLTDSQQAINALTHQVLSDQRLSARFNPSKRMIKKLQLGRFMTSSPQVVDLCYMLIQREENQVGSEPLDYHDFTSDERSIQKLRRKELAEQRRVTMELVNQTERLGSDLSLFRNTTTDSFAEFINLVRDTEARTYAEMEERLNRDRGFEEIAEKLSKLNISQNHLEQQVAGRGESSHDVHRNLKELGERMAIQENSNKILRRQSEMQPTIQDISSVNDNQFQKRVMMLQTELKSLQEAVSSMFEHRVSALEANESERGPALQSVIEGLELNFRETVNLTDQKLQRQVQVQINEVRELCGQDLDEGILSHRSDMEQLVKKLGANIQEALEKIQNQTQADLEYTARQTQMQIREGMEEFKQQEDKKQVNVKIDRLAREIEQLEKKLFRAFQQRMDNSTSAIEESINATIVSRIRQVTQDSKTLQDKFEKILNIKQEQDQIAQQNQDNFEEHITLIEALSRKQDAQVNMIEENKDTLVKKLNNFEQAIKTQLEPLQGRPEQFSTYDKSFTRIETDMREIYQQVGALNQNNAQQSEELDQWRQSLSNDMELFYNKYDSRIKKLQLPSTERKLITDQLKAAQQLSTSSKEKIRLMEMQIESLIETSQKTANLSMGLENSQAKAVQNQERLSMQLELQMRKMTQDVFEQVKVNESNHIDQKLVENRREQNQRIQAMEGQILKALKSRVEAPPAEQIRGAVQREMKVIDYELRQKGADPPAQNIEIFRRLDKLESKAYNTKIVPVLGSKPQNYSPDHLQDLRKHLESLTAKFYNLETKVNQAPSIQAPNRIPSVKINRQNSSVDNLGIQEKLADLQGQNGFVKAVQQKWLMESFHMQLQKMLGRSQDIFEMMEGIQWLRRFAFFYTTSEVAQSLKNIILQFQMKVVIKGGQQSGKRLEDITLARHNNQISYDLVHAIKVDDAPNDQIDYRIMAKQLAPTGNSCYIYLFEDKQRRLVYSLVLAEIISMNAQCAEELTKEGIFGYLESLISREPFPDLHSEDPFSDTFIAVTKLLDTLSKFECSSKTVLDHPKTYQTLMKGFLFQDRKYDQESSLYQLFPTHHNFQQHDDYLVSYFWSILRKHASPILRTAPELIGYLCEGLRRVSLQGSKLLNEERLVQMLVYLSINADHTGYFTKDNVTQIAKAYLNVEKKEKADRSQLLDNQYDLLLDNLEADRQFSSIVDQFRTGAEEEEEESESNKHTGQRSSK